MVRRSSVILAATLAVFSIFEPTLCVAGGAPGGSNGEVDRPRFLKKNVRRYYNETTSSLPGGFPGGFAGGNGYPNGNPFGGGEGDRSPSPSPSPTITTPSSTQTEPAKTTTHTSSTQTTGTSTSPTTPSTLTSRSSANIDTLVQGAVVDQTSPSSTGASSPSSTESSTKAPTTTSSPGANQSTGGKALPSVTPSVNVPVENNVQQGNTSPSSTSSPPPSSSASGGTSDTTSKGGNSNTGQNAQAPSATSTTGGNVVNEVVGGLGKGSSNVGGQNTATNPFNDQNTGTNTDTNVSGQQTNPVQNPILANVVSNQPASTKASTSSNRFGGGNNNLLNGGSVSNTGASGSQPTSNPEDGVIPGGTAANKIPASVTSGGVLVANPQITPSAPIVDQSSPDSTNGGNSNNNNENGKSSNGNIANVVNTLDNVNNNVNNFPASVTSNAILVANPQITPGVSVPTKVQSGSNNDDNGIINDVVNTLDTANKNVNTIPASVTSGGVLVPNPQATGETNENSPPNLSKGTTGDIDDVKSVGNNVFEGANNAETGLTASPTTIGNNVQDNVLNSGNGATNDTTNPSDINNNRPANIPASITSNGQLVSNPLATIQSAANLVNVPASITSGGVLVSNPEESQAAQVLSGLSLPVEAAQPLPSVTSNGVLIPNPSGVVASEVEKPATNDTQGTEGLSAGVIPNVPASITSGGVLVANPAQTNSAQIIALPQSVTLSNGVVIPNPALTASGFAEGEKATLSQESANNTNGVVLPLPQQSGSPVGASTTLPNGDVVPVSNPPTSPSSPSNAGEFYQKQKGEPSGSAAAQASTTLPNGSVIPVPASTTLPNGSVVPVVSGAQSTGVGASPSAQAGKQENNTLPSVTAASGVSAPEGAVNTGSQATATGTLEGQSPESKPALTAGPVATTSQAYPSDGKGPFTQQPISYDQNTVQPVESSITYEPSSAPATTGTETVSTGIPSNVPQTIYPPTGPVARPPNCDLIQIAFLYPLNYDFVWIHSESQKQIFTFLPKAIGHCLSIELVNITMQTLKAWDTTQDLHYITTVALAWIPSHLVDTLGLALHTPAGTFYNHPDPSVKTLVSMVNNAVPIRATNETDSGSKTGSEPEATTTGAAPIGGNIGSSSPVQSKSVAIGVGVACGAAAYGAAMFFVARRYKKRRQSHMRSPSMFASPVMSHVGADPAAGQALMSGAMNGERSVSPFYDRAESRGSGRSAGSSGRQQISAPVMAENSLGWN
ncbi:uncharacterized protein KY384_003176 [Bacidia gigantensis]|uniref:uncharacterized protein n=1 Tax=Bacidia gigantensis TaxID=2732470 RepID=UPI001D0440F4|nr:uncharacterized protein KY384_003176 [Bacidia gigantensis]KAG8531546.1 hypothetical protein KY384_003176 [Bacidia gigantensis]